MKKMKKNTYFSKSEQLNKKINSEKFKLSEKILDLRYELGYSFDDMYELLEMSPEKYLDYEYGEDYISVSEYNRVIEILENQLKVKDKSSNIKRVSVMYFNEK